ncbi:MAG: hypothetical protein V9G04_15330 [Nocardioides sp.]
MLRRRIVGAVAAATTLGLAATAASLLAGPAHAASPTLAPLTWQISQQYVDHLSTRTLEGGLTFDDAAKTFSWPAVSTAKQADGDIVRTYAGSVKGAFAMAGTEYYSVTVANPIVTVEPDGDGRIQATVSAANAAAMGNPAASTSPALVTVAEFSGATATGATPHWAGVLPADSAEAVALGIPAGKPVDGKAFNPSFLTNLTAGVRAHFYATGGSSDAKKAPAAWSLSPKIDAAVTASSYATGVKVSVSGAGFNPVTNPGDAGIYVGLAPADLVIDYSTRDGMSAFAAVDWVAPDRFVGDTFETVLAAGTAKLVSGKAYAIYTWQAHTRSNATQDTKTAVNIDWASLQPPVTPTPVVTKVTPTAKVKLTKKPARGKAGKAVLRVRGSAGAVTGKAKVAIGRNGKVITKRKVTLKAGGKAVVRLPKGKRGKWRIVARYQGSDVYKRAKAVKKYRVR